MIHVRACVEEEEKKMEGGAKVRSVEGVRGTKSVTNTHAVAVVVTNTTKLLLLLR